MCRAAGGGSAGAGAPVVPRDKKAHRATGKCFNVIATEFAQPCVDIENDATALD